MTTTPISLTSVNPMKPTGNDPIEKLRKQGYMILILSPQELQGTDPKQVENALQAFVPDVIEDLKD